MATTLQHPCHVHPLELMGTSEIDAMAESCGACGHPIASENLFGCRACGFFLHRTCAQYLPSLEGHPAHPQHPLLLFYGPHNISGSFPCNICGKVGGGWSYRCNLRDFGIHLLCAHMPRTARRPGHQHPFQLLFRPPSERSTTCHACRLQIHHCGYKCSRCGFVLHPGCLTKQQANDSRREWSIRVMAWQVTAWVARNVGMRLLLDVLGEAVDGGFLSEAFDNLPGAADVPNGNDDFSLGTMTFDDLPGADGVDDPLQEETTSLLLAHMEGMGGDTGASEQPSTSSGSGRSTTNAPAP